MAHNGHIYKENQDRAIYKVEYDLWTLNPNVFSKW